MHEWSPAAGRCRATCRPRCPDGPAQHALSRRRDAPEKNQIVRRQSWTQRPHLAACDTSPACSADKDAAVKQHTVASAATGALTNPSIGCGMESAVAAGGGAVPWLPQRHCSPHEPSLLRVALDAVFARQHADCAFSRTCRPAEFLGLACLQQQQVVLPESLRSRVPRQQSCGPSAGSEVSATRWAALAGSPQEHRPAGIGSDSESTASHRAVLTKIRCRSCSNMPHHKTTCTERAGNGPGKIRSRTDRGLSFETPTEPARFFPTGEFYLGNRQWERICSRSLAVRQSLFSGRAALSVAGRTPVRRRWAVSGR